MTKNIAIFKTKELLTISNRKEQLLNHIDTLEADIDEKEDDYDEELIIMESEEETSQHEIDVLELQKEIEILNLNNTLVHNQHLYAIANLDEKRLMANKMYEINAMTEKGLETRIKRIELLVKLYDESYKLASSSYSSEKEQAMNKFEILCKFSTEVEEPKKRNKNNEDAKVLYLSDYRK